MNLLKKILSFSVAVLLLAATFTISSFAAADYNTADLEFVKDLVLKSSQLGTNYDINRSNELVKAAEFIGNFETIDSKKRLVSVDLVSAGIVDVSGELDALDLDALRKLNLSGNVGITALSLPKGGELSSLDISNTSIKDLDASNLAALTVFNAAGVNLDKLNLKDTNGISEWKLGSVADFTDNRGVKLKLIKPETADMIGLNYDFSTHKVTMTYRHPSGEIYFNKASLPSGAESFSQDLMADGQPYSETTIRFILSKNMTFDPDFVSNSVEISKLLVNGNEIKPNGAGVFVAEIPFEDTELDVAIETVSDQAKVDGAGKLKLVEGENIFTITVTSADGSDSKEYTLKIVRVATPSDDGSRFSTNAILIIVIVLIVLAVGTAGFIYYRKNKAK